MAQFCYVCRTTSLSFLKNARNIFCVSGSLPSERKLCDVLSEILDKKIVENESDTNILCIRCANMVMEYDLFHSKLKVIKTKIQLEWTKGKQINQTSNGNITVSVTNPSPAKKGAKKIVLPASKLQPLPANFVLNVRNLSNVLNQNGSSMPCTLEVPSQETGTVQITSPAVTQENFQTAIQTNIGDLTNKIITNALREDTTQTLPKTNSLMTLNLDTLPNDFMGTLTKVEQVKIKTDEMEVDENCTITAVPMSSDITTMNSVNSEDKSAEEDMEEYIALNVLTDKDDSNEAVFSGFNIVDGDGNNADEGQHTLVVDGTNSSALLRLMVGQKFMYGDKQISLVMKQDSADSNDEDIELQVSGDEETANAIIAAQEQGGAYIKVESGEMFQVQCVETSACKQVDDSADVEVLRLIRKEQDGMFTCLLCEKNEENVSETFTLKGEDMMQHLKTKHSARLYICCICGYAVRKRTEYNRHLDEHRKESAVTWKFMKYDCDKCDKKFFSKQLLSDHKQLHGGVKQHSCDLCLKTFSSKYTLQYHMKTHTDRPRKFACTECSKSFMTQQNLNQHIKTHKSSKDFVCNVCEKAFSTQHSLEVHGLVHSGAKKFICDICKKGFARKQELTDHIRVHTGERPFACQECGASFSQRSNLNSHLRHTHRDDRRYACTYCPKKFKRRRLLEYHVQSRHTGERPLPCEICGATFVYPEHYRKHKLLHTGYKPYVCESMLRVYMSPEMYEIKELYTTPRKCIQFRSCSGNICGKSFNSRDNRNTHRFVHSDKKPYECVVCGTGFMRKQALYSHMHQSGHLAETIVVNQPRIENVTDKIYLQTINTNQNDNTEDLQNSDATKVNDTQNVELVTYKEEETAEAVSKADNNIVDTSNITSESGAQSWEDGVIRIVEIQLPNGNNGWVAINS